MALENKRLRVLGEINELMKNASHIIRIILVSFHCFPLSLWQFNTCSLLSTTSFCSVENIHWWHWVVLSNQRQLHKLHQDYAVQAHAHQFMVKAGNCMHISEQMKTRRWKCCSSALPFHVFRKSWFLRLYSTIKIQKNVIVWLYHNHTVLNLLTFLPAWSFLKWFQNAISVV